MATADVIIIGGGLHGCSAALHLARRGIRSLVIEKDHVGRHASGVNAGGVRRLGRHLDEIAISCASMEIWHRIRDLVDDDCGFEASGQVKVAETEDDLAILRRRVADVRRRGFEHEVLVDQSELRRWLPAVAPHCVGGIVVEGDGAANPYRTTLAFRRKAASLGVRFREGERVTGLQRTGGVWQVTSTHGTHSSPIVVNCAGAWAAEIAALLGEPVPLEVIAPMMMITGPMPPFLKPVVGATSRPLSFKQMPNGTVMIGGGRRGTPLPDRNESDLNFRQLALGAQTVLELFPVMAGATLVRAWAGLEARMPDDIPVIGPSSTSEGVFHAFGFSAHGFQMGPGVGAIVAELIANGSTNLPISAFDIRRFRQVS
jgi:sarcosine oxidase subunit beta